MASGPQVGLALPWWRTTKGWAEAIILISAFATLIALALALKQWQDSKQIIEGLSTRYIGSFPDAFQPLSEFLKDQDHVSELDVISDFAAPGEYSASENAFNKYFAALETPPNSRLNIKLLIYSNEIQEKFLPKEFSDAVFTEEKRKAAENDRDSRMIAYFARHHTDLRVHCPLGSDREFYTKLTLPAFTKMLMYTETEYQARLKRARTDLYFSDQDFPFYLWLKDDKEAIFAIHGPESLPTRLDGSGLTMFFRTTDRELIKAFRQLFGGLWGQSDRESRKQLGKQFETKPVSASEFMSLCKE